MQLTPPYPSILRVCRGWHFIYLLFFVGAQNVYCGHSLEPSEKGGCNAHQGLFLHRKSENIPQINI